MMRTAKTIWLGFALAAIFFYPLAAALDSDPYYLQWQPSHSVEALVAVGVLTIVFAALLHLVLPKSGRGATIALGAIALIPLLSLGAGLSRQLPIGGLLRELWQTPSIQYGVPGVAAAVILAAFVLWPDALARGLQRLLLILSPIALVVMLTLVRTVSGSATLIERSVSPAASASTCPSIIALLFDEMSFAYLYDGTEVRAEFPNIRAFAARATNYLNVRAPGDETMVSVPGYLAGRAFDNIRVEGNHLDYELGPDRAVFKPQQPDGLFARARGAGYSPEVAGYYFPYCELLGTLADRCRSFSFYNVSTARTGFSPVHPIMTTLILWPMQFPLGLLKNPPFAALQRSLVEETTAFAERPMGASPPAFRLVHFSIPHLPFVFDEEGYDPPFNPLRQRPDTWYVRQLHYADRLFGELMARMQQDGSFDRTTVVLFSDHGFRSQGRETNSRHVPFLVKRAGQAARMNVMEQTPAEQLLMQVVTGPCQ
jgi:hypothetical protein